MVYIRYCGQGNHHTYGHTFLANLVNTLAPVIVLSRATSAGSSKKLPSWALGLPKSSHAKAENVSTFMCACMCVFLVAAS